LATRLLRAISNSVISGSRERFLPLITELLIADLLIADYSENGLCECYPQFHWCWC